jgi:hypothetical protein
LNNKKAEEKKIIFFCVFFRFINIRDHNQTNSINEWDDPKTRNIAYCAVIYNEFLKELAAITLEHSVQQFDDDQIFDDISPISLML